MAQPVEQLIRNQQVTSSNLVSSSKSQRGGQLSAPLAFGAIHQPLEMARSDFGAQAPSPAVAPPAGWKRQYLVSSFCPPLWLLELFASRSKWLVRTLARKRQVLPGAPSGVWQYLVSSIVCPALFGITFQPLEMARSDFGAQAPSPAA